MSTDRPTTVRPALKKLEKDHGELVDYDALLEDHALFQDEIENMKQLDALWTLLPDDADTEELQDVTHWFGDEFVLEVIRDVAASGGENSK